MGTRFLKFFILLAAGVLTPGCLLNSVHQVTRAPREKPDFSHAIVVIGMGIETASAYPAFEVTLDEYSVEKQDITGNCFKYNRIEAERPSGSSTLAYLAFEVPAGTYVYSRRNANSLVPASSGGSAFKAPPGKTVYFGDYVLVSHQTVEFRQDLNAARSASRQLLPKDVILESAEPAKTAQTHPLLCTP